MWVLGGLDHLVGIAELRAPDEVHGVFSAVHTAVPDLGHEIISVTAQDDRAVVHWRMFGTFNGSGRMMGLAPNGRSFEILGRDLFTVRDGLTTSNVAISNGLEIARQLWASCRRRTRSPNAACTASSTRWPRSRCAAAGRTDRDARTTPRERTVRARRARRRPSRGAGPVRAHGGPRHALRRPPPALQRVRGQGRLQRGVQRRRGAVLNVASTTAFQPTPGEAAYAATKAYVLSFTEALHTELTGSGVRVTALCPGPVKTEFMDAPGMDEGAATLPKPMWFEGSDVAEAGVSGLENGGRVVVPGLANVATTLIGQHTPRRLLLPALRRITRIGDQLRRQTAAISGGGALIRSSGLREPGYHLHMAADPMLTTPGHAGWADVERERIEDARQALGLTMAQRLDAGVRLSAQAVAWANACQTSIGSSAVRRS